MVPAPEWCPAMRSWNLRTSRSWSHFYVGTFAVIAFIALAALCRSTIYGYFSSTRDGIERLALAQQNSTFRAFDGRVSDRFTYKRRKSAARDVGADGLPAEDLRLLAVASKLAMDATENPTAENLQASGVSYMLLGKPDKAVETLMQALYASAGETDPMTAINRCRDAVLLNSLAAAYQMQFAKEGIGAVRALALEASQAAWRLRKTAEIAWTRALIIDSLFISESARDAWQEYLALDPDSSWSIEARRRINVLSRKTDSDLWPAIRERLMAQQVDASVVEMVRRYPQQVRLWCEDELLPAWGEAVLRADSTAGERFTTIATLGRALAAANGEESIACATEAIAKANQTERRVLAQGHSTYGMGRKAMSSDAALASRHFEAAVAGLDSSLTTFAFRAQTEHAAALYARNEYPRALAILERLATAKAHERGRSVALQGRIHWAIGLINLQMGYPEAAVDHYRIALNAFDRLHETDHRAALNSLLADAFESVGQPSQAVQHRDAALRLLNESGNRQRRHSVIFEAAYAAVLNDQPVLAELLLDRVVAHDLTHGDPVSACTSLMWRSAYSARRQLIGEAESDLRLAWRTCTSIHDPPVRERALANLGVAQSILGNLEGRVTDLASLDSAIQYYDKTDSRVWLRTAHLVRAQAYVRAGEFAAAEAEYQSAITESSLTREDIGDREMRMSFTATADEVMDAYVDFLLVSGKTRVAFEVADSSRAQELVSSPTSRWRAKLATSDIDTIRKALPLDARLIEYCVIKSRVIAWVLGPHTFETVVMPLSIGEITRLIEHLGSGKFKDTPPAATELLYDALVRPLEAHLPPTGSLIVVPDDELERVPYGALYDKRRDRYLVRTMAISILPSAALFRLSALRFATRANEPERVIVVNAGKARQGSAALPGVTIEAQEIARLFSGTRIVEGANTSAMSILQLAKDATILHFAGHTVMQSHGKSRGLALGDEAGALSPSDVLASPLPKARLVFLSACATDAGPILKAEGSATISRAFFAAGVPIVVATLWPVEDDFAREMSHLFYEHLSEGHDPAEALRRAQVTLSVGTNSRTDWAAYRIVGTGMKITHQEGREEKR
jgi:tetratricopeptide (TPR) repeat protein